MSEVYKYFDCNNVYGFRESYYYKPIYKLLFLFHKNEKGHFEGISTMIEFLPEPPFDMCDFLLTTFSLLWICNEDFRPVMKL